MRAEDIHHVITEAIWTILVASGPVLAVAMAVGLGIALFQALTSVQEMTLTFVPKIAAIFVTIVLCLPLIYSALTKLTDQSFDLIVSGGL
ncbi:flagellar biosynthesis protein FliQ [Leisingera sp. XS_AS12]|uniref:flagellar biosynthesis protein FliQ n=1 Tax=Leisingera TaxID=191028 RepID=UPI0003FEBF41|nr:flagellar biosynthesis protein FliQ [Leisingera caerulea]